MNIYEDGGKWCVWKDMVLTQFDTRPQAEWFALRGETLSATEAALAMGVMMAKLETARAIVAAVKTLTTAADSQANLVAEYWDVSAAFGAFTDGDVESLGIALAQLQAGITLLEQFGLLVTGANDGAGRSTITPSDYLATINTLRRVAG